jgi:hypothetical protein
MEAGSRPALVGAAFSCVPAGGSAGKEAIDHRGRTASAATRPRRRRHGLFASGLYEFASGLYEFASGIYEFASGLYEFASGLYLVAAKRGTFADVTVPRRAGTRDTKECMR